MTQAQPTRTWDSAEAAELWRLSAARRAQAVGAATEAMLDAVGLQPGMKVLDIAAGTGDQSLLAAQRVGPTGSVLATDISSTMLAVAAEAARDAGLSNVTTLASDGTSLELPEDHFDAAICRFGLMFMTDLNEVLARVRRALKPGSRFAALVWSTEERNPWIAIQVGAARDMDRLPSPLPSIARTTSLGEPGKLAGGFYEARFRDVDSSTIPTPREFASLAEALEAMRAMSPAHGELQRDMNESERERFNAEVERRLAAFARPDGRCVVPGESLLGVGTR
jgi:SAM-dependent methyltransferase